MFIGIREMLKIVIELKKFKKMTRNKSKESIRNETIKIRVEISGNNTTGFHQR